MESFLDRRFSMKKRVILEGFVTRTLQGWPDLLTSPTCVWLSVGVISALAFTDSYQELPDKNRAGRYEM